MMEAILELAPQLIGAFTHRSAAKAARKQAEQIPDIYREMLEPYVQTGHEALGRSQQEFQHLLDDPSFMINQLMDAYHASPAQAYARGEAQRGIDAAAATGGMLGTPAHQLRSGRAAADIGNLYAQDYLNRGLGQYGLGLQGESGLASGGFGAASNLADALGASQLNLGNLDALRQRERNQLMGDALHGFSYEQGLGRQGGGLEAFRNMLPFMGS